MRITPTKVRAKGSKMTFDPRPLHLRKPNTQAVEQLRCDLLAINKPCAFLKIIIPSIEKIARDHTYCSQSGAKPVLAKSITSYSSVEIPFVSEIPTADDITQSLCLNCEERQYLEENTRSQSSCSLWFEACPHRITCGRIIQQREKTQALLRFVMYPKPMLHPPKPIQWGNDHEEDARQAYLSICITMAIVTYKWLKLD